MLDRITNALLHVHYIDIQNVYASMNLLAAHQILVEFILLLRSHIYGDHTPRISDRIHIKPFMYYTTHMHANSHF